MVEIIAGSGGEVGGVGLSSTGGGAAAGVPVIAASTAVIAHGTLAASTGVADLLSSPILMKGSGEGGGDAPNPGNIKRVKGGRLRDLGINAHKVKKFLGKEASNFDIAQSSSGGAYLISKDKETIIDLEAQLIDLAD